LIKTQTAEFVDREKCLQISESIGKIPLAQKILFPLYTESQHHPGSASQTAHKGQTMAFSIYGNNAYNPVYNRYAPSYGNQPAYGANSNFGQLQSPVASPLPGTIPTQGFPPSPGAYSNSQTFGANGYSNASYNPMPNPIGTPNGLSYQQPYRTPAAQFSPGRPFNPASYAPYPAASPYQLYASQASLSQQEQRKKYWSKFILNTGSTLAGLSLAAYFGMKILPKAIVSEMGIQVKNNLLSRNTKGHAEKQGPRTVGRRQHAPMDQRFNSKRFTRQAGPDTQQVAKGQAGKGIAG